MLTQSIVGCLQLDSSTIFSFWDYCLYSPTLIGIIVIKLIMKSNLFHFDNNDIFLLSREMKKLINNHVLTYKHCQSMKMTGKAKPSETEAAESDFSVSVVPAEESKEEEKTLASSSTLTEPVVESKEVKKIQIRKELKRDEQDVTEAMLVLEQIQIEEKLLWIRKR